MKQLILLGGGHAHLHVLRALAEQPLLNTAVTLVSPQAQLVYSAMVPGLVAGHYGLNDIGIDLQPLAAAAHANFVQQAAPISPIGSSSAPPWLAHSGFSLDEHGFIATSRRCKACRPEVFAAGDATSRPDAPHPRSGVYGCVRGRPWR